MEPIIFPTILIFFAFLAALVGRKYQMYEQDPIITPKPPEPMSEVPKPVPEEPKIPDPIPSPSPSERLYKAAYESLGLHRGLDKSVSKEINCANALTHIMILVGVKGLPATGIASTAALYAWLVRSKDFEKVATPEQGDIICYPTGYGNGSVRGHAFVKGRYQLMSNNSKTGLWDNHWKSLEEADTFYTKKGGIPRSTFRWLG